MTDASGEDIVREIEGMVRDSTTAPEVPGFWSLGHPGLRLLGCLPVVLGVLALALTGIAILNALMGGGSGPVADNLGVDGNPTTANGQAGSISPSSGEGVDFIPRPGVWDVENLPFLPACGPGSLGSGFQEGTIEVVDDGAFIIASGSQPGTATIELSLVDVGQDRLVYLGIEPITGLEMTMTFTSPTEMDATVKSCGEICLERPAVGAWDREIGEPEPDAAGAMPPWMPSGFPVSSGGRVNTVETNTTKTVSVVVEDRHPTDVLFNVAAWAVDEGHVILERGASTLTIRIDVNRLMNVEVIDVGNFNTQLTVTIEQT
jgi:hypothetical protein